MKQNIKNSWGILFLGLAFTSMVSCSDDDEQSGLISAVYPSSIEMVLADNVKELVYTEEETNASVLPLLQGEVVSLGYKMYPEDVTFNEVEWTSANTEVATVTAEGEVEALQVGYAIVQVAPVAAYSGNGVNSALKVLVVDEVEPANSVSVTSEADEVYSGEQLQFTANILPETATYRTVRWSSSNEAVATVDSDGLVTGMDTGQDRSTVTITATALDGTGVSASKEITVIRTVIPESVTIDQAYAAGNYEWAIAEKEAKLVYTTVPENCTTSLIEWTSSDESIATVKNGVVTFNQEGNFGNVVITALCPETGNSSSITLNLAAGLIRELFHDEDNYTWYNAKQSANNTSSSHVWEYGKVTVTTYTSGTNTQRADFKCWSAKTWLHAGNYPYLAIRMEDVKDKYSAITGRNINIDSSGKCNGTDYKGSMGGNNAWVHDYKCSDGSHVFIYDLSTQKFATGGVLPQDATAEFTTLQFKYADIKPMAQQITYSVYWVQTFKTLDDISEYVQSEGLTYEVIK